MLSRACCQLASGVVLGLEAGWTTARTAMAAASREPAACFLVFHSIGGLAEAAYVPRSGTPSLPVDRFRQLLHFFARRGFKPVTASQFAERQAAGAVEPRTLVLTFDDGFRDNYAVAAPILAEMGMTATFYPVCGWIGRRSPSWLHRAAWYADQSPAGFDETVRGVAGEGWTRFFRMFRASSRPGRDALLMFRQGLRPLQQREVLEDLAARLGYPPAVRLYMNWQELNELRQAGMEIGAHTMTHRSLWTLDPATAKRELVRAKQILECRLGAPVRSFAYPYGHFLPAHVAMAEAAGYTHAVTVRPYHNGAATAPFELGRYGISSNPAPNYLGRISLGRTEDPMARFNRWLGRHLGQTIADPDLGMVRLTRNGWAYEMTPAAVALHGEGA